MYTITATANNKNRTYTIRQYDKDILISKYRTFKMNKQDFKSNIHNTLNDWKQYLKSYEYYRIR